MMKRKAQLLSPVAPPITVQASMVIGSASDVTYRVSQDESIAPHHARLQFQDEQFLLTPLEGKVWVDGVEIYASTAVSDQTLIRLGTKIELLFRFLPDQDVERPQVVTEDGTVVPLQQKLTLGRAPTCDIVLSDRRVSASHAEIVKEDGIFFIVDQQSDNGTYVNGVVMRDQRILQDYDHIQIASHKLIFRMIHSGSLAVAARLRLPDNTIWPLQDSVTTIGRHPNCRLSFQNGDDQMSGYHAKIERRDGNYILSDTQSRNGTYVNDVLQPKPYLLRPGDIIRVGNTVLPFSMPNNLRQKHLSASSKQEYKRYGRIDYTNRMTLGKTYPLNISLLLTRDNTSSSHSQGYHLTTFKLSPMNGNSELDIEFSAPRCEIMPSRTTMKIKPNEDASVGVLVKPYAMDVDVNEVTNIDIKFIQEGVVIKEITIRPTIQNTYKAFFMFNVASDNWAAIDRAYKIVGAVGLIVEVLGASVGATMFGAVFLLSMIVAVMLFLLAKRLRSQSPVHVQLGV